MKASRVLGKLCLVSEAHIILVPGIAADGRLVSPQQSAFGSAVTTMTWIDPEPGETIHQYTRRWSASLDPEVVAGDVPVFLVGVSLGCAFAREMAKAINPEAMLMIGGPSMGDELTLMGQCSLKAASLTPTNWLGKLNIVGAIGLGVLDGLDRDHFGLVRDMALDTPEATLKWQLEVVGRWVSDTHEPTPVDCPVHRLHGRHDWLIKPLTDEPCEYLPDGRHLINLSLDTSVNDYIREVISGYGYSLPTPDMRPPVRADRPDYMAHPA